jgi:alanine-alpha-ketoisovalerate/valine-pyruvate aminotransferase
MSTIVSPRLLKLALTSSATPTIIVERHPTVETLRAQDEIYKLDGDWSEFPPAEAALFTVSRKLAASPVVLTDDDMAQAIKLAGPRDVVQLISYTTNQGSFDRITEAAHLRLKE